MTAGSIDRLFLFRRAVVYCALLLLLLGGCDGILVIYYARGVTRISPLSTTD